MQIPNKDYGATPYGLRRNTFMVLNPKIQAMVTTQHLIWLRRNSFEHYK